MQENISNKKRMDNVKMLGWTIERDIQENTDNTGKYRCSLIRLRLVK